MQDSQNMSGAPMPNYPNPMPNPTPVQPVQPVQPIQPMSMGPELQPTPEKPAKKGLLWLIIIVIVVLIGVGVAAAVLLMPKGNSDPTSQGGQETSDKEFITINERIEISEKKVDPETMFYDSDGSTISVREMIQQYSDANEQFYPQNSSDNRYIATSKWGEGDNRYLKDLMDLIGQPNLVYQNYSAYQDDEDMMTGYGLLVWEVEGGGYLVIAVNDFTNWKGYDYEYYTVRFYIRPLADASELNAWINGYAKNSWDDIE